MQCFCSQRMNLCDPRWSMSLVNLHKIIGLKKMEHFTMTGCELGTSAVGTSLLIKQLLNAPNTSGSIACDSTKSNATVHRTIHYEVCSFRSIRTDVAGIFVNYRIKMHRHTDLNR